VQPSAREPTAFGSIDRSARSREPRENAISSKMSQAMHVNDKMYARARDNEEASLIEWSAKIIFARDTHASHSSSNACDAARFSISSTSPFAVYDSVGSVTTEVSVKPVPRALRVTLPPPL